MKIEDAIKWQSRRIDSAQKRIKVSEMAMKECSSVDGAERCIKDIRVQEGVIREAKAILEVLDMISGN